MAGFALIVAFGWSTVGALAGLGTDIFVSCVCSALGSRVRLDIDAQGWILVFLRGTGGANPVTVVRALGGS